MVVLEWLRQLFTFRSTIQRLEAEKKGLLEQIEAQDHAITVLRNALIHHGDPEPEDTRPKKPIRVGRRTWAETVIQFEREHSQLTRAMNVLDKVT